MLMTAAQWNLRLENEYRTMCAFPINKLFSWKVAPGQSVPRCKEYLITYNVTTMVKNGGSLKPQEKTEVLITLPDNAEGAPTAKIVDGCIPFNPNIYANGKICLGNIWLKGPRLWQLVINIGKVLAFDPALIAPGDAANKEAAQDWIAKQSGIRKHYPCGNTNFPHPVGY